MAAMTPQGYSVGGLYTKYNQGPTTADLKARIAGLGGGNDVVSYTVIEPPDDRYYPGYSVTQADGDVKTVGPRLKDLNIPFSLYGLPIPVTFGVRRLYGNMIWAIPLRENVKKKKKGGGKGGGSKSKSEEYEYFATFAVGFGYPGIQESDSRKILRIWADGSLIFDRRTTGATKIEGLNFVFYEGSETQTADPTIEEKEGTGQVPAYRGMMYMVFKDLPVKAWGDRPPAISVEIGDSTSPQKTVTNIYPDAIDGSRDQTDGFPDWNVYQYYTFQYDYIRTYDLLGNTVLGYASANPNGVGWANNTTDSMLESDLQLSYGVATTNETPGYIPWINKIVVGTGGSGLQPVMLLDPISGIPSHWIGCVQAGTNAQFPKNHLTAASLVLEDYPFYKGYIPAGRYYTPQLVYNLYWVDTFIFCNSIVYGALVVLHLRGKDNILDMLWYDNTLDYQEIVAGTVGYGYSDVYPVGTSTIYRARLTTLTQRLHSADGVDTVNDFEITTWKSMGSTINNVWYLASEDALAVLLSNGEFYKYNCEDGAEILHTTITGDLPNAHLKNKHLNNLTNGTFAWDSGTYISELDFVFGTVTTYASQGSALSANFQYSDSVSRSLIGIGFSGTGSNGTGQSSSMNHAVSRLYFDRLGDDRIPLADFLEGVAMMAGYDSSEIEVSANIDDTIDGALITNVTTFRNIMDPTSAVYRFDIIESGGKVKFVRKALNASATDFTVADGDVLLPDEKSMEAVSFQLRREEEANVPERINLRYIDKALSYQFSMQFSTRSRVIQTNDSNNQITYELPIVMTASEAKALSYRALWTAWNSRVAYSFRLPQKYLKMEPSDIGTITASGITYTVKAVEVTYNNDFTLSVKATGWLSDDNVTITADEGSGYPQTIPYTFGSDTYIIDIPLLLGEHDMNYSKQFPVYVVVGAKVPTDQWNGGSMWAAYDGLNFEEEVSSTSDNYVGIVATVPTVPTSILQTDFDNTITVYTKSGDSTLLVSCTEDELLNGANVAAYGDNGRWEVIQFQNVTDNGNNSFTLSNILRGRRGTDYAVDNHRPGDKFVLLDDNWVQLISFPHSDVELSFRYKAVSFGQNQGDVVPSLVALEGYGATPWPPVNLRIERSLSALTGDLTITWNRRSRTVGTLVDGAEYAPLEDTEENDYKVTIRRWRHKDYAWNGSTWAETTDNTNDEVSFEVTGATTLTLTTTQIRDAELYEYAVPDTPGSYGTTFTQTAGSAIAENADANEQIVDLGYDDFVAFKYLEIMVQQKTNIATVTGGYGPGRWTTVVIEDT